MAVFLQGDAAGNSHRIRGASRVAKQFIERLRGRIPYIRRLHCEIDDLRHQLASLEQVPIVHEAAGNQPDLCREFRAFLRLLQPYDVIGFNKQRIGGCGDGGYVMLDDFASVRHALSLGIGQDVSWDAGMAARNIRVMQYDHSVSISPQANERFAFHRRRVVAEIESSEDITLAEILSSSALAADNDIVAKFDIESAELGVLARTDIALLRRIRQVAIEFHGLRNFADERWRATAVAALNNLTAAHCCIHIHGNNWGPFAVVGGVPFPIAFEATFVRRADYRMVPSEAVFPTKLDWPCNPKRPDLFIGRWSY
jgi:hypothetical protein